MQMARRMLMSFVVVLNIVGFLIVLLVIANGSVLDDVRYIAEGDAALLMVIAVAGFVANILLGYLLVRGSIRSRSLAPLESSEPRPRITGE